MSVLKTTARIVLGMLPARVITGIEFRRQSFQGFNERPIEFAFVFRHISRLYPTSVLDVGTGKTALPHLIRNCGCVVTASDNVRDFWPSGMSNRHYHVIDDDITNSSIQKGFDFVTCVSVLEHIKNHQAAMANMLGLLNPGGHLIVTCPYSNGPYVENVYRLEGSNAFGKESHYTTQSFSGAEVSEWCSRGGATIADQEHWQCWEGPYWTVGKQVIPPRRVTSTDRHQLTCLLLKKGG
jgi:2-polyprenyl-3-methyl-5-hydroxy-6-metoxy-1,4-benzoquinol methylase